MQLLFLDWPTLKMKMLQSFKTSSNILSIDMT
jgi:hypothetical protein